MAGRLQYFTAFHEACAGDPFIWGGDFNTGLIQLATFVFVCNYTSDEVSSHVVLLFIVVVLCAQAKS